MARIDSYVDVLFKQNAERVVFGSDEKATLIVAGRSEVITEKVPPQKVVDLFLSEIVPPALKSEVAQPGRHDFRYDSPHGATRVKVTRSESLLRLELAPDCEPAAAAPPPAPVAPPPVVPERVRAPEPPPVPEAPPAPPGPAPSLWDTTAGSQSGDAPQAPREQPRAPTTPQPATTERPVPTSEARQAMDALFHEMVGQGCSDLHLCSGCPPFFRKDGSMVLLSQQEPMDTARVRELLYAISPAMRLDVFEAHHDADFSYEIAGLARFRANLFMDRRGIGGVFRVIPDEILTAQDLGLSQHILDLCGLSKGLVVVTGPTGSGKSTTLAAMIDHINETRSDHIITIEDPIEFVHPNKRCLINQREIGDHTDGFKPALRAALREDPDIVLVGEMRDLETIEIALETAETGHLVFGTLHTNTAPSTVDRIIDQFATDRQEQIRTMLADSLRGVVAQTLCKKKGGGRIAALEVLIATPAISNLIREGKTFQIPSVMQTGKQVGMLTMNDALLALVQQGLVEPEQAYAKATARAEFKGLLQAKGIALAGATDPE